MSRILDDREIRKRGKIDQQRNIRLSIFQSSVCQGGPPKEHDIQGKGRAPFEIGIFWPTGKREEKGVKRGAWYWQTQIE